MQPLTSPRYHGLDTLRALAIALVFMNHYRLFVDPDAPFGWLGRIGWSGVDLFFGLSGYLIGNQIFAGLRSATFSFKHFYARRLLRTLPNFYVVLALYYLWPGFRHGSLLLPVWKFLTFTQNMLLTPGTAFSHAWSLCVEEQFYLLLPALAWLIAAARHSLRWAWLAVATSLCIGMVARAYFWQDQVGSAANTLGFYRYIYYSSLCRFDELVAGVALALLKHYHPYRWARLTAYGNRTMLAGSAGLALAVCLFLDHQYDFGVTVFGYPLLAASFALLIVAALSPACCLYRMRVPGAQAVALWSYAIYLLHKQVCIVLASPLRELGIDTAGWPAVAALTAASVAAGWALFALVETPCMRWRARHLPALRAGLAAPLAPRPPA